MTATAGMMVEREGNNTALQSNLFTVKTQSNDLTGVVTGAIGGSDRQDYFRIDIAQGVTDARFSLSNLSANLNLEIRNTSGRLMGSGVRAGTRSEAVTIRFLPAGTYYIRVFKGTPSARSQYSVAFSGRVGSDGPAIPRSLDVESNDTPATARSVGTMTPGRTKVLTGSLNEGDSEDWYKVPVLANGSLKVDLTGMSADLDVEVQDSTGNRLGVSDFGGQTSEQISLTGLPSGDYFVRIWNFQRNSFQDAGSEHNNSNYTLSLLTARGTSPATVVGQRPATQSLAFDVGALPETSELVIRGNLSRGYSDWYKFQVPHSNWEAYLELTGPDEDPLRESLDWPLPAGTYFLNVGLSSGYAGFPRHWGERPRIEDRVSTKLPLAFGWGSLTLDAWIRRHLDEDLRTGRLPPDSKQWWLSASLLDATGRDLHRMSIEMSGGGSYRLALRAEPVVYPEIPGL